MSQRPFQAPKVLPAPFGRYKLLKLLGQGGMGTVYLAQDTQLDRRVALKIPLFDSADGSHVLERFYREARAAATVHHPNICPIYDVGENDGVPYLTMAFIEGRPLAEIAGTKPLTPRQSALLVRKLALALAEAHQQKVIHRDLKPANIMIDRRSEPIVMDFGLARRSHAGDVRMTQEGSAMGTPSYMPPEQVSGNVDLMGPGSDIYSLGVILYELLAGRLPFRFDERNGRRAAGVFAKRNANAAAARDPTGGRPGDGASRAPHSGSPSKRPGRHAHHGPSLRGASGSQHGENQELFQEPEKPARRQAMGLHSDDFGSGRRHWPGRNRLGPVAGPSARRGVRHDPPGACPSQRGSENRG
jgi:serine/threonine protein kinase